MSFNIKAITGNTNMNNGYDNNGYITDYSKLNAFDKDQLDNAMAALDGFCYDHGYDGVDFLVETRLDGSHVIGSAVIVVYQEGSDKESIAVEYVADFYGNIQITNSYEVN